MILDFHTLYIVIILVTAAIATIWATICLWQKSFRSARTWCAACGLMTAGGILLPFQHTFSIPVIPAAAGNGLIILGIWFLWGGLRCFDGKSFHYLAPVAGTVLTVLATIVSFGQNEWLSLVYVVGQSVPMSLTILALLRRPHRAAGVSLTCVGIAIGLTGHAAVAAMNLYLMHDSLPDAVIGTIASFSMLGVIFSGILWNFGFAVMTMERLRDEVSELADTDPLTGQWNRRKFDLELSRVHAAAQRTGRAYAILLLDLDHFKEVNDRFGHKGGDECLVHFAGVAKDCARYADIFARIGGDEFCILLPETTAAEARALGEQIVRALRERPLLCNGDEQSLSCSIGAADFAPGADGHPDAVLSRADKALYSVKGSGRGGVAVAAPALAPADQDVMQDLGPAWVPAQ